MRILVIEDDQKLADILQRGLNRLTYAVDITFEREKGVKRWKNSFTP